MPSDRDYLDVRVGMGYEKLCVNVKSRTDSNGFQLESDEVRELTDKIIEETRIVDNVPARISFVRNNTIGITGNRGKTINLIRNMLISLTSQHCFSDVKIVGFLMKKKEKSGNLSDGFLIYGTKTESIVILHITLKICTKYAMFYPM